jgi:hypothetical protein
MKSSYRVFILDKDSVSAMSKKNFISWYFDNEPVLPQFSGQTIQLAIVFYSIVSGRPERILSIESQRIRIAADGSLDEELHMRSIEIGLERTVGVPKAFPQTNNVVNATSLFKEREWRHLHPEVSGPALKQILDVLFH